MSKTIEKLKDELAMLEKAKKEKTEYEELSKRIKELKEEGSTKSKVFSALRKVRAHLHENGKKFNDTKEKAKKESNSGNMFADSRIVYLSSKGDPWGTNKGLDEGFESPLYKKLTEKKK
jgi:predicted nuclease with TOPRIM domain